MKWNSWFLGLALILTLGVVQTTTEEDEEREEEEAVARELPLHLREVRGSASPS